MKMRWEDNIRIPDNNLLLLLLLLLCSQFGVCGCVDWSLIENGQSTTPSLSLLNWWAYYLLQMSIVLHWTNIWQFWIKTLAGSYAFFLKLIACITKQINKNGDWNYTCGHAKCDLTKIFCNYINALSMLFSDCIHALVYISDLGEHQLLHGYDMCKNWCMNHRLLNTGE